MAVDMNKMRRSKQQKRAKEHSVDWNGICGYTGDGETVGVSHDGTLEAVTDKAALVFQDGEKLWLPFSQIQDADSEAIMVTLWWCDKEGIGHW